MITIKIWSDFACPYCYIGEKRLNDAIKELGWSDKFEIIYKAFELDPGAAKVTEGSVAERLAKKYNLGLGEARQKIDSIDAQGREAGIDMRFGTTRSSNTLDAHRLMKLAEARYDGETVSKLNEILFSDYFTKNLVLSDHSVLLEAAVSAGIKEEDAKETLNSDAYEADVRKDESEAAAMGVHGVPYIVFHDKYAVPGALSIDDFKSVLRQVFDEVSKLDITERAKSCDETGCTI